MNTYYVSLMENKNTIIAETDEKAKYQLFKENELESSMEISDFLKKVTCTFLHEFQPSDLFTSNIEQFEHMKQQRSIEFAHLGMKVEVNGKPGVIVGYYGLNLLVCFEGLWWGDNCHPWWRVKYFDDNGSLVKEYFD